jgi:amino acid transporter
VGTPPQDEQLKHDQIGLLGVLVPGAAVMAPAASILFGVAVTASVAGAAVPLIFLIATVGILATGASLAKLSHRWPSAGSFVTFITRTMGGRVGLFTGTAVLLGIALAYAGIYVFIGDFIANAFLHTSAAPWPAVCMVLFVVIVLLPVIRGVEISIELAVALLAIELIVMGIVTAAIFLDGGPHGVSLSPFKLPSGGFEPIGLGFAITVLLYAGFEQSVPLAEESKDPRRNVPRAIFIAIIGIGAMYILSSWALVLGFGGGDKLAQSADPLHDAAEQYASWVAPLIRWVLLSSFAGFAIAANTAFSRVIFNTAREGLFPRPLAHLVPRWKTPAAAAVTFGGGSAVIALIGKLFTDDTTIVVLFSTAGTMLLVLMYILVNTALVILYFRDRRAGVRHNPLTWVGVPIVGSAVLAIPYYYNLKPGQVHPLNLIPWFLVAIGVLAVVYTVVIAVRRPDKVDHAGRILAGEAVVLDGTAAAEAPVAAS